MLSQVSFFVYGSFSICESHEGVQFTFMVFEA